MSGSNLVDHEDSPDAPSSALGAGHPALAAWLASDALFIAVLLSFTVAAIVLGGLTSSRDPFDADELLYTELIRTFERGVSLEFLQDYGGKPASPAPLFFFLYAGAGKLFGSSVVTYRSTSLALTLAAVCLTWIYVRRAWAGGSRDHFPLLLYLFPYIFAMGFAVMAEPLTLLLTVIGLIYWQRALAVRSNAALLVGTLALAAALYVRVHAIFVVGALGATLLLNRDFSVRHWLAAAAPLLLRLPLIFWQGGLTVDRTAHSGPKPELGFAFGHLSFFFIWLGYLFFPLLFWQRARWRVRWLATACLLPLYIFAPPDFYGDAYRGALNTALPTLAISPQLTWWLLLPAWLVGASIAADIGQRALFGQGPREQFLCSAVLLFGLSLLFSSVAFERYYQLAVVPIVFLGLERTHRRAPYVVLLIGHLWFAVLAALRFGKDVF